MVTDISFGGELIIIRLMQKLQRSVEKEQVLELHVIKIINIYQHLLFTSIRLLDERDMNYLFAICMVIGSPLITQVVITLIFSV